MNGLKLFFVLLFTTLSTVQVFADTNKQVAIELLPVSENDIDNLTATAFGVSLAGWVSQHEDITSMSGTYQPTYDALYGALSSQIKIWSELKEKNSALDNPYMNELLLVEDARYLKEYVWVYHMRASDDHSSPKTLKVSEFKAWAMTHLQSHKPRVEAKLKIE